MRTPKAKSCKFCAKDKIFFSHFFFCENLPEPCQNLLNTIQRELHSVSPELQAHPTLSVPSLLARYMNNPSATLNLLVSLYARFYKTTVALLYAWESTIHPAFLNPNELLTTMENAFLNFLSLSAKWLNTLGTSKKKKQRHTKKKKKIPKKKQTKIKKKINATSDS